MKYVVSTLVFLLIAIAPALGQSSEGNRHISFLEPPTGPSHGGADSGNDLAAGVYLLIPDHPAKAAGQVFNTIVTFNADGCADSSSLWDGDLGAETGRNTGSHGTWRLVPRTREVEAHLFYFTYTPAGLVDRVGRATLIASLNDDLSQGFGEIIFDSFLPSQLPAAFLEGSTEEPAGGRLKVGVKLVQLR